MKKKTRKRLIAEILDLDPSQLVGYTQYKNASMLVFSIEHATFSYSVMARLSEILGADINIDITPDADAVYAEITNVDFSIKKPVTISARNN